MNHLEKRVIQLEVLAKPQSLPEPLPEVLEELARPEVQAEWAALAPWPPPLSPLRDYTPEQIDFLSAVSVRALKKRYPV